MVIEFPKKYFKPVLKLGDGTKYGRVWYIDGEMIYIKR